MIDGNPLHPDLRWQWRLAEETGATLMGASPGFLMACRQEGVRPAAEFDLSRVRQIGAAGSPLPPEGYRWVAEQFGPDVLLNVGSGGTDVCSGHRAGQPRCSRCGPARSPGPASAWTRRPSTRTANGSVGELGELVITAPMPSMPVGFWGDDDGSPLPRHLLRRRTRGCGGTATGCRFSEVGSCVIAGRSDATLNRGGVRLGTAEFYRVVEELPEVADSLVVHLEDPAGGNGELLLYVQLRPGADLDDGPAPHASRPRCAPRCRRGTSPTRSPRCRRSRATAPARSWSCRSRRSCSAPQLDDVASRDVLADPTSLDPFVALASGRDDARSAP